VLRALWAREKVLSTRPWHDCRLVGLQHCPDSPTTAVRYGWQRQNRQQKRFFGARMPSMRTAIFFLALWNQMKIAQDS